MLHSTQIRTREIVLPRALLVPGIATFLASLAALLLLKRVTGFGAYDLSVLLMGGDAWVHGYPVYEQTLRSEYGIAYFTYPPITLLVFAPLSLLSLGTAHAVTLIVNIAAVWTVIWLSLRMVGCDRGIGMVGATFALAGAALWLQPVHDSIGQGQVNIVLLLLIVADFALGRRPTGILIGVAAAVKLTPGIFIVYLLLIRRFRAAATAAATSALLTGLAFLAAPIDSERYWFDGTFANAKRLISPVLLGDVSNQSINGVVMRLLGEDAGLVWLLISLGVAVAGLWLAVLAHRRVGPFAGVLATAVTGLLISPVSWHEHWVWIVPITVWLLALAHHIHPTHQLLAGALPVVLVLPFLSWPFPYAPGQLGAGSLLNPVGAMWNEGNHGPLVAVVSTTYVGVGLVLLVVGWWSLIWFRAVDASYMHTLKAGVASDGHGSSADTRLQAPPLQATPGD